MSEETPPLPLGWVAGRLADFAQPRGEKVQPSDMPNAIFLGMDHIEAHTTRIIGQFPASSMKSAAARFYAGDVLYGRLRPYLNKVAVPSFNGLASAEFIVFPDTDLLRSRFLKHRLNAADFVNFASHLNEGDRPRVGFDQIGAFPLRLPPPKEQARIVAKLEELFSELDKGVEALEKTRAQLDLYRSAVLHEAVHDAKGCLFPTQALGEVIGEIGQGWSPKCDTNRAPSDQEWAIIKTTAVQPMAYLPNECKPLPDHLEPRNSIVISDGDLLMTRKGPRPRTGVVCYVKKARMHSMLCDTVYRFRSHEDVVIPEYLELALNSPRVVQEIDSKKSGISESGISLNHGRVRAVSVPIPKGKGIQERIVQVTRQRLSLVEQLDMTLTGEIRRAEVIRQSILKQAFFGELVAQDPREEAASALLERLRAECGGTSMKKSRNGKNAKNGEKSAA